MSFRYKFVNVIAACVMVNIPVLADEPSTPTKMIGKDSSKRAAELMQEEGFRAKIEVDEYGEIEIHSASGGSKFSIYFTACDESVKNCEIILFSAGFDFEEPQDIDTTNEWNQSRHTKAFLDDEGDPYLQHSVNVLYGVSEANFIDTLSWFTSQLAAFEDHIGWNDEDESSPDAEKSNPI